MFQGEGDSIVPAMIFTNVITKVAGNESNQGVQKNKIGI